METNEETKGLESLETARRRPSGLPGGTAADVPCATQVGCENAILPEYHGANGVSGKTGSCFIEVVSMKCGLECGDISTNNRPA